jgi:hypothetical protein
MSKKQLLSEGEIRRFMKFAKLEPLAESFISETYGMTEGDYLDEEEEPMEPEEDDMGGEEDLDMGDEEEPMDDMADEAPAGGEDVEAVVADALQAAVEKINAALEGVEGFSPITLDKGAEEMEAEMEPEAGEEELEMEPEEEAPGAGGEEMVAEVTRRVMARISESRRREARANAIDEVTNRIMKRILKGK